MPAIATATIPPIPPRPTLAAVPVTHPDGIVSGTVTLQFLRPGVVWVATAPIPDVLHDGRHPFAVSVEARRTDNGRWDLTAHGQGVTYTGPPRAGRVPAQWTADIAAALRHTLGRHWTRELDARAAHADAVDKLTGLAQRARVLLLELGRLDAEAAPYLAVLDADPRGGDGDVQPPDPLLDLTLDHVAEMIFTVYSVDPDATFDDAVRSLRATSEDHEIGFDGPYLTDAPSRADPERVRYHGLSLGDRFEQAVDRARALCVERGFPIV
jgi:hypothetical protein